MWKNFKSLPKSHDFARSHWKCKTKQQEAKNCYNCYCIFQKFLILLCFLIVQYLANPVPQAKMFISIPIYLQWKLVTFEKACAQDTYKLCPGVGNSVVHAC